MTIVSGLPRSGTSMMMRMLEAGGLPVLTDGVRRADVDNPGGYYELERAKRIKQDCSWLEEARGRVFKMVSMLLLELPGGYRYDVVFMQRAMAEILASQARMLERLGKTGGAVDAADMARFFERHLEKVRTWLASRSNIRVLFVDYRGVLRHPLTSAVEVARFLDRDLDTERMAAAVDPSLYRNREGD